MKKTISVLVTMVLSVAMIFSLTACGGLDMDKVKGEWTLDTFNGMTVKEVAESSGTPEYACALNYTVTDDKFTIEKMELDGTITSTEYDIKVKSNGFEVYEDGEIAMSVSYDEDNDTLSYQSDLGGTPVASVLKKGSADLKALYDDVYHGAENYTYGDYVENYDDGYAEDYSDEAYTK